MAVAAEIPRTSRSPATTVVVAGVPVTIRLSFLALVAVLGLGVRDVVLTAAWVVVATAAVLVHEAGHAAALRCYGSPARIVLGGLGGATTGAVVARRARLVVSLAGPAAGLVVGVPLLVVEGGLAPGSTADVVVRLAVWATVGWSVVNLVPVLPLDGGRAAAAGLSMLAGRDVTVVVVAGSVVLATAVAVITMANGFVLLALLCVWLAAVNAATFIRPGRRRRRGRRATRSRRR